MTSLTVTSAELVPDENGVMMHDYGWSIGKVYNPKVVAQQGIKSHDDYRLTGDLEARQKFISAADWLLKHSSDKGEFSLWEYNFRWKS